MWRNVCPNMHASNQEFLKGGYVVLGGGNESVQCTFGREKVGRENVCSLINITTDTYMYMYVHYMGKFTTMTLNIHDYRCIHCSA